MVWYSIPGPKFALNCGRQRNIMTKSIALTIILFLTLFTTKAQLTFPRDTSLCDTGAWKLVWQDEFNGTQVDKSKWYTWIPTWNKKTITIDTFASSQYARHGTGVLFMDSNVVVSDGTCKIYAYYNPSMWITPNDSGSFDTLKRDYTGGMLHTYNAGLNKGRYEIRCKLPEAKKDVHATFWTWGNGNHNEIDFFEWYGEKKRTTDVVHYWHPEGQQADWDEYKYKAEGWHTYTTDWDENFIRFYVDGKLKHTFYKYQGRYKHKCKPRSGTFIRNPAAQDNNESCEMVVSLESDQELKIPPGDIRVFEIDYVRVYERINTK